jgi:hypothetical protein
MLYTEDGTKVFCYCLHCQSMRWHLVDKFGIFEYHRCIICGEQHVAK